MFNTKNEIYLEFIVCLQSYSKVALQLIYVIEFYIRKFRIAVRSMYSWFTGKSKEFWCIMEKIIYNIFNYVVLF